MKQIFEEFDSHQNERSDFIETHIEPKEKQENNLRDIFLFPSAHHPQEIKEESSNIGHKYNHLENFVNEESGIFEELESNFFVSPSCNKKYLPALGLIAKVSRNSHPSPSFSSRPEDLPCVTLSKQAIYREEPIEISFDPR